MNQSIHRIPFLVFVLVLTAAIFSGSATASNPSPSGAQPALSRESSVIPGQYIVVFKDSVEHPGNLAEAQTEQRGGKLGYVYRHALKGYAAELSKSDVEALRKDPRVDYVVANHRAETAGFQSSPTGIQRIFATENQRLDIDESDDLRVDVDIAIIDTGIGENQLDLNVAGRTDCITEFAKCVDGVGTDEFGHGTHVAGTAAAIDDGFGVVGVAPGARLWAVKVLDKNGNGSDASIAAGVDWVTAHAKDIEVANMSLQSVVGLPATATAIAASVKAGVVHVAAAGNFSVDAKKYAPGNHPDVITVSALADFDGLPGGTAESSSCRKKYEAQWPGQKDDTLAHFSNYGKDVEVAAPGVCIYSTYFDSAGAPTYIPLWGTSMASPHVAGAAALLASESNPEDKEDVESIRTQIVKAGNLGWTDTSPDGIKEPLLDVGDEGLFDFPRPPSAKTEAASSTVLLGPTLNASVNPNGYATTYQFEYGTTTGYGSKAPVSPKSAGAGTEAVKVSEKLPALAPNTLYHFRIVATNVSGTVYGEDLTFKTPRVDPPTFTSAFGTKGSGEGQFNEPSDVAVDSGGNLWVLDMSNQRVQKFNSKGEYLSKFGSSGTGNGQFTKPRGIAIDPEGDLWVTDFNGGRIQQFNSKGEYLSKIAVSNSKGIDFDSSGNLWVATGGLKVKQYSQAGSLLVEFGKSGTGDGQFLETWDVAVASDNSVWVLDPYNRRIQKFSPKGEYIAKFGSLGSGDGQFSEPQGLEIDADDTLWVSDSGNHRVQEIYPEGEYVTKFGSSGSGEGQFKTPKGLAADNAGNLWIVDSGNNRVQKWTKQAPHPVETGAGTAIKRTEATLNGKINPQGVATSYQIEYGTTTAYGTKVPASPKSIGSGSSPVKVSEALVGLKSGTVYHYRVVATSEKGTTYGEDRYLTTLQGAGVGALWRLGGKTFAELGIKEESLAMSGSWKIEFPTWPVTLLCAQTAGTGTLASSGPTTLSITLKCELPGKPTCTIEPVKMIVNGSFSSFEKNLTTLNSKSCGLPSETIILVNGTGSFDAGTEAVKLPVTAYHSTTFGTHPVIISGPVYWNAAGKYAGKTLGVW